MRPQRSKARIFSLVVICFVSWLLVAAVNPYGAATSPDSLAYLDLASNLRSGQGFVATDLELGSDSRHKLRVERSWPPLYPLLLSLGVEDSRDTKFPTQISQLLLAISVAFTFLVLCELMGATLGILVALLLSVSTPMLTVFTYAWSETLFVALLCVVMWLAMTCQDKDRSVSYPALAALVISLIALVYTRYIGLFAFIVLPWLYLTSDKKRGTQVAFLIGLAVYLSAVCALLVSNWRVSGSISGRPRPQSDASLLENTAHGWQVLRTILPEQAQSYVWAFVVAALFFLVSWSAPRQKVVKSRLVPQDLAIPVLLCLGYLGSIFLLRSISHFDPIDVRLLAPSFPSFLVLLVAFPLCLKQESFAGRLLSFTSVFLLCAFAIAGQQRFVQTLSNWRHHGSPGHPLRLSALYNNFTPAPVGSPLQQVLVLLAQDGGAIVMERPLVCRFLSKAHCLQKPGDWDEESIGQLKRLPPGSWVLSGHAESEALGMKLAEDGTPRISINFGGLSAVQVGGPRRSG